MSNNLLNGLNNLANSFMELIQNNQRGGKVRSIINRNMKYLYDLIMNIDSHKKGYKSTIAELKADFPNPKPGDYAYVGETWTVWVEKNGQWVNSGKPIPNDPEYMDELEKLKNRLYSEGVEQEHTRDIITSSVAGDSSHSMISFFENYSLLFGKYIESIRVNSRDGGKLKILIGKNIGLNNFTYESILVDVNRGATTIPLNRQLASNETIGVSSREDSLADLNIAKGTNGAGGRAYEYIPDYGWQYKNYDLGITITERVFLIDRGDILRLNDEKADKVNDKGEQVVYSPGGKVPEIANTVTLRAADDANAIDISSLVREKMIAGKGIRAANGITYDWSFGTIIERYKLKPNTRYLLRGLRFPHNNTEQTLNFFNSETSVRSYGIVANPGDDIVFETNGSDIYISFYVDITNYPPYSFSSKDFIMLEGVGFRELVDHSTKKTILNLDNIVSSKRAYTTKDLTAEANNRLMNNITIAGQTDGSIVQNGIGTIVYMLPLNKNAKYKLTLSADWTASWGTIVNLYRSNDINAKKYTGVNITAVGQRVIEFDTDNQLLYLSFYKNIPTTSQYAFANDGFKLEETTVDVELRDTIGLISLSGGGTSTGGNAGYVEKEAKSIEVDVPIGNIRENAHVNCVFTDGANAGVYGTMPVGYNSTIVYKLPVEENEWYEIDMGVDMKGTLFVFGYADTVTTASSAANWWCPISSKTSFKVPFGVKSISFFISLIHDGLKVDFDAKSTFKVKKITNASEGFQTDYGFIDLKSIPGVIDMSDEEFIDIPIDVNRYGVVRTWGTQVGISANVRAKKRIEILIGNVYVEGFTEEGFQGSSTMRYMFKNLKDKLYRKDGVTKMNISLGGTPARNKFHRKAWFTDVTASNSLVSGDCWQRVFDYRPDDERYIWSKPYSDAITDFDERFENGACMHTVGIHVVQYDNGAFIGLRTLQTNTERDDFRMYKKSKLHNCFKHGYQSDIITDVNRGNWEELNSDTEGAEIPDERFQILTNWQTAIKNLSSSNGDFKAQAEKYIYVRNWIDYYIYLYWIGGFDNWGNNILLCTHDGVKMDVVLRDLDYSAGATPPFVIQPDQEFTAKLFTFGWAWILPTSTIWKKITDSFMPEIKARYIELRDAGVWNEDVFIEAFRKKEKEVGYSLLKKNADTWRLILTNRPADSPAVGILPIGGSYDSFRRKYWWFKERRKFMDQKFGQ